jgi:diphthine-ammonia ligase
MRLVALVSGGKDSVLSMMLAQAHGHEIAYLANLRPPVAEAEQGHEDVDSYCFQTVGSLAIEALAEALNIPLRRATIHENQSVNTQLVYGAGAGSESANATRIDEVEVMYALLHDIVMEAKEAGAPIGGVCSGAILSDYQRLRVEHACARLGLVSYAYLWQVPQETVLALVAALRVDASIIKVASMGLNPRHHLNRTVVDLTSHLLSLRPHVHVAGEGGEFESFVTRCPLMPDGTRLELTNTRVVMVDDNPIAPTGFLRFDANLVRSCDIDEDALAADRAVRSAIATRNLQRSIALRGRSWCRDVVESCSQIVEGPASDDRFRGWSPEEPGVASSVQVIRPTRKTMRAHRTQLSTGNVVYHCEGTLADGTAADNVRDVFSRVSAADRQRICYTMVFLPDLGAFASINAVYADVFGVSPPSRAVVEINRLATVAVDIYFADNMEDREVLHVQSISNWAAACIGPYAQANRVRSRGTLVTAGMLGLEPGSMCLAGSAGSALAGSSASTTWGENDKFAAEFRTCVDNLAATLERMKSGLSAVTHLQFFTTTEDWAARVASMWQRAAETPLPSHSRVIIVSRLPRDARVEVMAVVREGDDAELPSLFWRRPGFYGDDASEVTESS